jgi:small subunit ribosomal protein S8
MSLSDPIADMLTRIRNAASISKKDVMVRSTKVCKGIAEVLKNEGYIVGYDFIETANKQGNLRITLKYGPAGESLIDQLVRVSKPGRRVYSSVEELPYVLDGMGISVVSTSKGVMSDKNCRSMKIGGEILCTVS